MRITPTWCLLVLLLALGCPVADDDDDSSAGDDDAADPDITEVEFGAFEPWSEPIADYVEALAAVHGVGNFEAGIHDLAVYEDRLYLGYGDATVNSAQVFPDELRYWDDPGAPDGWKVDGTVDEEQVERYRAYPGSDVLWIAGVDATEDELIGNVYHRTPDDGWFKSRTLDQGLHVHDVAEFGGAVYACGSGGTWDDYSAGHIGSLLWASSDGGETFELVEKQLNDTVGDRRFTQMVPLSDGIYLFGYSTNADYLADEFLMARYDGVALEWLDGLERQWAFDAYPLSPELGLVHAIYYPVFGAATWRMTALRPGGQETEIEALGDVTLADLFALGDGRWLLLAQEGNEVGAAATGAYQVHLTADLETFTPVAAFQDDVGVRSLAYWRGALYLGRADGSVWRAEPL